MLKSWKKRIAELLTVTMILGAVPFPAAAEVTQEAGGRTAGAVSSEENGFLTLASREAAATESNASFSAGDIRKVTAATADNAEMSEDDPDGAVADDLAEELPDGIIETLAPAAAQTAAEEEDEEIEAPELIHVSLADEDLPDSAELLEGYLEHLAGGDPPAEGIRLRSSGRTRSGYPAGSMEDVFYGKFLEAAQDIAAGERTSAEITVSWADIGIPADTRIYYGDIGYDRVTKDPSLWECLGNYYGFDSSFSEVRGIIYRLISRVPYDFYWFDKTSGYTYGWSSPLGGAYDREVGDFYVTGLDRTDAFVMRFSVAEEFQGSQYETDAEKTGAASTAVSAAQSIVDQYAGLSDYEILQGYVSEICALTSYNYEAAGDDDYPYGNPWQLIWVFDGDPETKVVCEGYSKAFNLLCDLTDFSSDVDCFLASGNLGSEAHMWNIVTICGESYLVDVTNMDGSTFGAPDKLFLRGGTSTGTIPVPLPGGTSVDSPVYRFEGRRYSYDALTMMACEDILILAETDYDPSEEPVIPVTGIGLDQHMVSVYEGDSFSLSAAIQPQNATNKNVIWDIMDPSIASMDVEGQTVPADQAVTVTALSPGQTMIGVETEDGGFTNSCELVVFSKGIPVTGITLDQTEKTVTEGDSFTLTATILPENASYKEVSWGSSDPAVVAVEPGGNGDSEGFTATVTALSPGTAVIHAIAIDRDASFSAFCVVTVEEKVIPVTGVTLDQTEKTITKGSSFTLNAAVAPENATNKNVSWSSSDPETVSVDDTGKVSAVGPGTAVIAATTEDGGFVALCTVTVQVPVNGVNINTTARTILLGSSFQLRAWPQPVNATNKNVTWTSSDPAVAEVDSTGLVTALKAGTADVTVETEDGGFTAVCRITVRIPVTSVKINTTAKTIIPGKTFQLAAWPQPSNATDKAVTWTSSNPSVATVSSTGLVTAVKAGTATVTVTTADGGYTAACAITSGIPVNGVKINTTAKTIIPGKTFQLAAWPQPANAANKAVTWTSSDPSVAAVSSTGLVTAVKAGTATVTVKTEDGGYTAVCKITAGIPVNGVKINTTAKVIAPGKTFQLAAWPQPANAANKAVTWTSSNTAVAKVSGTGLVTAVKAGTATITVKTEDGGYTAVCKITVDIPVTGVKINTTAKTITAGKTFQLAAWPQPSNALNKQVTWSSSNAAVATVSSSGLVRAVKKGTAVITVKTVDGGFTKACRITVR